MNQIIAPSSESADLGGQSNGGRSGVITACFAAGFVLTGLEVARWLGLRNYQSTEYYLVTVGLALGSSFLIGLLSWALRMPRSVGLAVWAGGTTALVASPLGGLVLGAVTALGLRLAAQREPQRPSAAWEGLSVGAALSIVLLKGTWLAHSIPFFSNNLAFAVDGGLAMLALLALAPFLLIRFHGPLRSSARAAVPLLLASWFALEPWTHRPSGKHRQPPSGFAAKRALPEDGAQRPDILLIVLDTLRADRLSVYGYERETTPELARLLKQRENAVAFPSAYSNGTWTVPSHASLFTGLMPNEHGAHFDLDGTLRTQFGMHEGTPRLAALLQNQGYATLGAYANFWLRAIREMGEGFDLFFWAIKFDPLPLLGEALRDALVPGLCIDATKAGPRGAMVNRTILDLVKSWDAGVDHPLFVFANYGDTHGPYVPPEPFRGTFYPTSLRERGMHISLGRSDQERERLSARYDEELLYLDHQLGNLLDELDQTGFLDHAWVFITSDHGEAFGEHGITEHGTTVHQEVVHVPLLVFPPKGVSLNSVDAPVSLVDVSATIAAIAGTRIEGSPGRDLRSLEAGSAVAGVEFYGDAAKAAIHGLDAGLAQRSVLSGKWKLVEIGRAPDNRIMLFDLAADPGAEHDLAAENSDRVEELLPQLPPYGEPARSRHAVDDSIMQNIKELGYTGDEQGTPPKSAQGAEPVMGAQSGLEE